MPSHVVVVFPALAVVAKAAVGLRVELQVQRVVEALVVAAVAAKVHQR